MTSATDNRTTLLPCPFCGGEAEIRKFCDTCSTEIYFRCKRDTSPNAECKIGEEVFWVEHKCKVLNPDDDNTIYVGCYTSAREAIEVWNRRYVDTCELYAHESPFGDGATVVSLVCGECGHETFGELSYNSGDFLAYPKPNYCPNCGRRVTA